MRAQRSVLHLLVLAALVIGLLPAFALRASPARADAAITIEKNQAVADFPNGLDFTLSATGEHTIRKVELLYNVADLKTLNLEVPTFQEGTSVDVSYSLDFRNNFQPSGVDITYFWRLTDDGDQTLETAPETLLWYDNRFEWDSVSSTDVTVYSYRGNKAFDQVILDSAQSTVDKLKVAFDVQTVIPIRIWDYNSSQDFSSAQQGNSSEWIAGTAYPQFHVILAVLPEGNKKEVGRVVPHEITHQMLAQATENPFNAPPTWFDEGMAVYNQANGNEDDQSQVKNAAEKGQLFSVRALNSNFPYDPADSALAYAESFSVVSFIIDTYGEGSISRVIDAYRTGVSHDDAMKAAIGLDLDGLDAAWKKSLDYPGDQPRTAGTTSGTSPWDDVIGPGLASGTLVLFAVVVLAGLFRFVSRRRYHQPVERFSSTGYEL